MEKKKLTPEVIQEMLSKTKIVDISVKEEMSKSFISYAMAVNVSRAIPDVRDGLKPVHRRILFAMNETGNTHEKAYRKCANAVGYVMGNYHPHGDSSIYDALVRMAQDFSMREMLIDGHGNFGSIDDGPAAQRYTEARLSKIANEMLKDIDKETVDFYPNFDDTRLQPVVLPARIPNLLVNGSEGIAVGMATSIPPHNLAEVINAEIALIDNPEITIDELIEYMPCPDYPTGGLILAREAVRRAYRTGRGGIVIRSRTEIEEDGNRGRIVVTELPYQVSKEALIKSIAEQVKDKRLEGISNIVDESGRDGTRLVIDIKRDFSPQVVLNALFKQTNLQVSTGIAFLALHNGVPRTLNLLEILQAHVSHRQAVVERRTRYLLNKAKEREHIVEGLVIALANIDEVIAVIKASKERSEALQKLMERFILSDKQGNAILDMRLSRLTGLEVEKLKEELRELQIMIADFNDILEKPERILQIIKTELTEIKDNFGNERRSELSFDPSEIDLADLIEKEDVVISMTFHGYIKRISVAEYKSQNRGGVGIQAHKTKEEDFVNKMLVTHSHDDLLFFGNKGKVYRIKAYQVPEATRQAKGRAIVNLLPLADGEKITAMLFVKDYANGFILMATKNGTIKKTAIEEFARIHQGGKIAISLNEGDELIEAALTTGENEILVASSQGKCIRFNEATVRAMGRTATGVRSMKIDKGERVVDMAVLKDNAEVITVTEKGYGKRSEIEDYRLTGRAGKGIKAGNFTDKTGALVNLKLVSEDEDIIIIADNGTMIRIRADMISKIGRASQGVRLMRLKNDGKVACMALTPRGEADEYDTIEGTPIEE
ncbi:MAG: DNA gyrase subunit A [Firmicutes bacterium]|nr:DNA gyrase subunit A [Bacillota bacterium]